MNIKFYKKLLSFRSHSKSQTQIDFRDYLIDYIGETHPDVVTEIDDYGNLYVTKGSSETYVNCVIAHLDINQKKCEEPLIAVVGDYIFGIDGETGKQIGLGHDDKTGVYFALQMLKKFDDIKLFFPLNEEVGLLGTRSCELEFFYNVGFMVQLDRRGNADISKYTNGLDVVALDIKRLLKKTLWKYRYNWATCVSTDVGELVRKLGVQGVNISCGYTDEHRDTEILNVMDYNRAEKFALEVLRKTDGDVFTLEVPQATMTTSTTTSSPSQTTIGSGAATTASAVATTPTKSATSTTDSNNAVTKPAVTVKSSDLSIKEMLANEKATNKEKVANVFSEREYANLEKHAQTHSDFLTEQEELNNDIFDTKDRKETVVFAFKRVNSIRNLIEEEPELRIQFLEHLKENCEELSQAYIENKEISLDSVLVGIQRAIDDMDLMVGAKQEKILD